MEPSPKRHVPVSVNVESLFSTSGQPAQMELLPNIQTAMPSNVERQQLSTNQSFLQVSPRSHGSSFKLALQQPLSINKQSMQRESTSKVQSTLSASKGSKQMSSTNKPGKMEPLTKVQSVTSPTLGSPQLSAKNKRKSQTEKLPKVQSINLGNQMASTNRRTAPAEPSPKVQTESFESVRSKLRESLAAALALVSEQQRKIHATGKKSSTEGTDTQGEMAYGSQQGEVSSIVGSGSSFAVSETPSESMSSKADQHNILRKPDESHFLLSDTFNNESASDYTQMWKCDVQDFGLKHTSLEGDVSFRNNLEFKDELLQENGLSWACDLDVESSESKENGDPKRLKLTLEEANSDVKVSVDKTQLLATQIEAKLFRLFGGVNKKYKEKGRSLLFNLKDPSNPELRERVFSEEISPERLCSMTAEELASKQLTEWRIAKAEELAQMVVLPELDVDLRRLVKKTHKGEFQVEVEQDDNVPVEVALGANALHQVTPRTNEAKNHLKSIDYETQHLTRHNEAEVSDNSVVRKKVDLGAIEYSNNLTTRAHDMQELMVDELKDAEFLPPIVSLDEFMEALDIEPPFDNLPVIPEQDSPTNKKVSDSSDARFVSMPDTSHMMNAVPERLESKSDVSHGVALKSDKGSDRLGTKLDHSRATLAEPLYAAVGHPDKIDSRNISANHDRALESSAVDSELGNSPQGTTSKGENVWEGLVQLNISSLVTVLGFFRSGEKASTKEWPSFLEIKGRVRVDAFEKFLQELPSSRSRAIMVACCPIH
uniref:PHD finger protein 3 n=1 Tax=Anthurium amnicola TaxID=1678845 RepID=A0A1D1XI44_9ARAE